MSIESRRQFIGLIAAAVAAVPFAARADDRDERWREHEERERWRHEHEEWREHQWREEEREERRARAEAEMRERAHMFHRENYWVGPGYYYDGRAYVYLNDPPPPYFWGETGVAVAVPPPSVDIVVPLRIR